MRRKAIEQSTGEDSGAVGEVGTTADGVKFRNVLLGGNDGTFDTFPNPADCAVDEDTRGSCPRAMEDPDELASVHVSGRSNLGNSGPHMNILIATGRAKNISQLICL